MLIILVSIFVFGSAIGSFIGAYTYRYSKNISVVKGRSFCPHCRRQISWYDNIPLFSFIFLSGKCRSCGKKISFRYPLIELSTGLLFAGIFLFFPQNVFTLTFLLFVSSILISIFIIDLENYLIPDELVFLIFISAFFMVLLSSIDNFYAYLLSSFSASLFLLILHLLTRGRGMGLGDVKLALAIGIFFNISEMITWLSLSFIIGAAVGIVFLLKGKVKFGKHIPFGPFLVISFFITLFWGERLVGIFLPWMK